MLSRGIFIQVFSPLIYFESTVKCFPFIFRLPYFFPFGIVSISFTAEGGDVPTEGECYTIWFPIKFAICCCKSLNKLFFFLKIESESLTRAISINNTGGTQDAGDKRCLDHNVLAWKGGFCIWGHRCALDVCGPDLGNSFFSPMISQTRI